MIEKSELLRVPAFTDLPDDQIAWFLSQSQEMHLKAGDTYVRQGDPADSMFVILEGQFQWRGEFGGETVVLSGKPGDVTGVLPFSRMKQFTVSGRAVTDGRVLKFPASLFSELVQKMPELTTRLVGMMSDRIREVLLSISFNRLATSTEAAILISAALAVSASRLANNDSNTSGLMSRRARSAASCHKSFCP